MPTSRSTDLRRRADALREFALRIEHLPVLRLDHLAGADTWQGPRAELCRATLAANQHQLHVAADELRSHALRLAREADRLDALALGELAG